MLLRDLAARYPGGLWRSDVQRFADEAGVSMRAVDAAATRMGVVRVRGGTQGSVWRWSETEEQAMETTT